MKHSKKMAPENIEWCRRHFASMPDGGGNWVLPRSGLVFQKRGNTLVLIQRIPPNEANGWLQLGDMAIHPKPDTTQDQIKALKMEYLDLQDSEFADTKRHFEAAGVTVIDNTNAINIDPSMPVFDGVQKNQRH